MREWPANGNRYAKGNGGVALTITTDMAPFVDFNGNGIYEPDREYPDVPGDQNLWWVFSDNGPTHSQTNGTPLDVEVHALAFAFKRWDIMDNIVYFQYDVLNKSANNYQDFRIGQYANMDLGSPNDDYVGCDTNRGLGIVYNSGTTDAIYGTNMPMAGVAMRGTGTTIGISVGNFIYCNNDASATGMPTTSTEYNNYLRSKFKDGVPLVDDFTASGVKTTGRGTGPLTNFVFPGNPADNTQWSECNSGNTPGDRRFILSSGDLQFNAGAELSVTMMRATTNVGPGNACGSADFSHLDSVIDAAVAGYDSHYHNLPPIGLGVANTSVSAAVNIYPNPANNTLFVENTGSTTGERDITIYNVMGQAMPIAINSTGQKTTIDISKLPAGLYQVVYRTNVTAIGRFVKE